MPRSFTIACDQDNIRLDIFLSEKLSLTRTKIKELIEGGHVRIDGKVAKPAVRLRAGFEITGDIPEEKPVDLAPEEIPLTILYEDNYFLAIDKPAEMVVHPSFGHSSGTLVNAVLGYMERQGLRFEAPGHEDEETGADPAISLRPGVVHRLDKGTTGVILMARDQRTQEKLSALFKDRNVRKTYRAIVEGTPRWDLLTVEGNIGRHPVDRKKMTVLKMGGRQSSTGFKVLERLTGYSYIEAYPATGRTHQIRVHLNHAGFPVVGDEMYGRMAKRLAARPLLHAYRIEFLHPATGIPVKIEAPVPRDMEDFLQKHRRQNG